MRYLINNITLAFGLLLIVSAGCGASPRPTSTNPDNIRSGSKVRVFKGHVVEPGLVFVPGGTTVVGAIGEASIHDPNIYALKTVSLDQFYIKETPVTHKEWNQYLDYLSNDGSAEKYKAAQLKAPGSIQNFNDALVQNPLQHPGLQRYPVTWVSWVQASEYCKWKTAQLQEKLAQEAGYLGKAPSIGRYRLPTEWEWETAAKGVVSLPDSNSVPSTQRIYPWDGSSFRATTGAHRGRFLTNFQPGGSGGIGGISPVGECPLNDLGISDMWGGNVSEWVDDLYSPQKARVYKGSSWKDCPYWYQIATRRGLDENCSRATISFRYAYEE